MPALPILDSEGKLAFYAPIFVTALMVYPENKNKQEEILATVVADTLQDDPNAVSIMAKAVQAISWFLPALRRAPSEKTLWTAAGKASGSSWAAADVLLLMLSAATHHPEIEINPTKVIYAMSEYHQETLTYGGRRPRAGMRTLWKAWSTFRPVAHFHAVWRMWIENNPDNPMDFPDWYTHHFEEFLACAEDVRRQAVMRRLLTQDEAWSLPDGLKLPVLFRVTPGALKPDMLELIRNYRPEHSKF